MRLLNVNTFQLRVFEDYHRPEYAIASHRWSAEEITLRDVQEKRNTDKIGYRKIESFAKYVREHVPGVEWLWFDTCCIDKTSSAEISEFINCMFRWYRDAVVCIAYLADVKEAGDTSAFARSEWFERGWTLPELLAPRLVVFVTATWQVIGHKGAYLGAEFRTPQGSGLEKVIEVITRIPERVLHDFKPSEVSVTRKLKWMEGRTTTRREDMTYALFGILEVFFPVIYGERDFARARLMARLSRFPAIGDGIEPQSDDSSTLYAESVLSFTTSASTASTLMGDAVSDALIKDFVQCLFCNSDLSPLNLAAMMDPAIGVGRFRKNVNRLIRHYGNDLKQESTSKDEVRVARVMRQGNVAVRAAQTIIDVTENAQQRHQNPSPVIVAGGIGTLATHNKVDTMESVLQRIQLQPFPDDDTDDDMSTSEEEFEDPGLAQQTFLDVKEALLESQAYARFKERLLDFVIKPSQKRILKAIGSQAISSAGVPLNDTALKALALELSFVPANTVTFSYREKLSYSDIVKGLIEVWMGESWDWSPLARRKFPLEDRWCRVSWKTPCDDVDYVDLPLQSAAALWRTIQSAPDFLSTVGGSQRLRDGAGHESAYADTASLLSVAPSAILSLLPSLLMIITSRRIQSEGSVSGKFAQLLFPSIFAWGLFGVSSLPSILWSLTSIFAPPLILALEMAIVSFIDLRLARADRTWRPDTAIFSGSRIGFLNHLTRPVSRAPVPVAQIPQQALGNPVPPTGAVSGTSLSTSRPPPVTGLPPGSSSTSVASQSGSQSVPIKYKQPDDRHVFLCVRDGATYKFSNIETHVLRSDSEFFGQLKSEYLLLRGSFKRWFSWWQYDRCDFYQFSKYPMNEEDEAVPQYIGYPKTTDTEYYFDPRPIDPCPPSGPISDQEFRSRFHKSCHQCHSWHLWHKRKLTGRLHSRQAIARLPKRDTALNMQDGKREIFWGIYARERRSFARVFAYGLLANTPTIVFFFLWLFQWGHASDLQNAAVPAGMSLSLTMLFMALLYESREIELR